MPHPADPDLPGIHLQLEAALDTATAQIRRARFRSAVGRAGRYACWTIGGAAIVIAALLATNHFGVLACLAIAIIGGCILAHPLLRRPSISTSDTAERIDLAFDTHNAVASALELSQAATPSPIEHLVIRYGLDRLKTIPKTADSAHRLGATLNLPTGQWAPPTFGMVCGIGIAAMLLFLHHATAPEARDFMRLGNVPAGDHSPALMFASATHLPLVADNAKGTPQSLSDIAAATDSGTAAGQSFGLGNDGTGTPKSAASGGAGAAGRQQEQQLGTPLTPSAANRSAALSPDQMPAAAEAANPASPAGARSGGASPPQAATGSQSGAGQPSASASASAAGAPGGTQQQPGGQPSPNSGTPPQGGSPGEKSSQSSSSSASAAGSPTGSSPHGSIPRAALDSDASSTQPPSGKAPPGRGGTKKSRGVPPLLLGATRSDVIAGPLLPGPEQRTTTQVPPRADPSATAPPSAKPPAVSSEQAPAVDPVPVDAADQPLVARYLISLHSDAPTADHP